MIFDHHHIIFTICPRKKQRDLVKRWAVMIRLEAHLRESSDTQVLNASDTIYVREGGFNPARQRYISRNSGSVP